jgi:predicted nucleic-acid-binding Zn-ribbon protein
MTDADRDAELSRLRAELDTLRLELAALSTRQPRLEPTMRRRLRCPGCGCRRIAHAREILDRGDSDSREPMALYQPSWWSSKVVGELEAYVCTECGLVEWYVKDPAALRDHDKYMAIVDGSGPDEQGPYR